jgi:hypothetical protein
VFLFIDFRVPGQTVPVQTQKRTLVVTKGLPVIRISSMIFVLSLVKQPPFVLFHTIQLSNSYTVLVGQFMSTHIPTISNHIEHYI